MLFLISAGLTLIFGVLNVINIAHGSFYMFGAYTAYLMMSSEITLIQYGGFWIALIISGVVVGIIGGIVERGIIKRIYDEDHIMQLLLTFSLVIVFDNFINIVFGSEFKSVTMPSLLQFQINVLDVVVPVYNLFLVGIGVIIACILTALFRYTQYGKSIRAAAQDREMAAALGVNIPLIYTSIFVLGSVLAGLGGALSAPYSTIHPTMGEEIIIDAFIVVVIGGLGSFTGAIIGSLLIGFLNSITFVVMPELQSVLPFLIMSVVILIRPGGLMGVEE
ncbi:branched-chain amino acid ABC transporter permease (plasmid) [Natrinema halophilum]|nr:branched-chain amino acid ABC transporter permease [Natrinema halophilum]